MAPLITSILLKWTQYNRSGKDSKVIQSWILPRLHFPAVWSWAGPFYPLFLKFLTYWMVTRHLPYVIIVISWHGQCVLYKWIYSHSLLFCFSCSLPYFSEWYCPVNVYQCPDKFFKEFNDNEHIYLSSKHPVYLI